MSAEVAKLWFKETRRICKLERWYHWLWATVIGLAFSAVLLAVVVLMTFADGTEKTTTFFVNTGLIGLDILLLTAIPFVLIFLQVNPRLRQVVAAIDCVEGSARAGFSEKEIESGCYLKIKLDARFPWDQFAGKWIWVGDTFQADHPDLVWVFEKFGSGKKWHQDYNFPPEPKIKVETVGKYHGQPVNLTLTFTTRRIASDPGRLLMDFGPFDSTIGRQLISVLRKRVDELLPNDLEYLRLDGSLADKLVLSITLRLPDSPDLTQQNNSTSAPYRVESAEISAVLPRLS